MRAVRVVRYSQAPSTPWKNGLGLTRQLAIHPHGATTECFEWRISIARLDQSADFSLFPGIERCLAVLEGEMTLQRDSSAPLPLTLDSPPVSFAGDTASSGQVVRGPVLDLNVMYQGARWHASLLRLKAGDGAGDVAIALAAEATVVCSLAMALHLQLAGLHIVLGRYDSLLTSGQWADQLVAADGFDAYCIELHRR